MSKTINHREAILHISGGIQKHMCLDSFTFLSSKYDEGLVYILSHHLSITWSFWKWLGGKKTKEEFFPPREKLTKTSGLMTEMCLSDI